MSFFSDFTQKLNKHKSDQDSSNSLQAVTLQLIKNLLVLLLSFVWTKLDPSPAEQNQASVNDTVRVIWSVLLI